MYLAYNGLTEPLGRRQVVPYLAELSRRGWDFTVISFEKPRSASAEARLTVAGLLGARICWIPLQYHAWPSVPATAYDILRGWAAAALQGGRDVGLLHARSTVAAAMARWARPLVRAPWIFDVRGLLADEYADAGHWKAGGTLHRLTHNVERRLMRQADGVVFLTSRIRERLRGQGLLPDAQPNAVIPCCVDLAAFRPSAVARQRIRQELGFADAPVLVYSGSLGSWYRLEEMLDFHAAARQVVPGLRFLILTPQTEMVSKSVARRPESALAVVGRHVQPDDVPDYLSACDAGICFLADSPSKGASSPTKYGEYLASGLPVITNRWTGDAATLDGEPPWTVVDNFGADHYARAAERLKWLLARPEATVEAARELARRCFSLDLAVSRYDALYQEVFDRWRKLIA